MTVVSCLCLTGCMWINNMKSERAIARMSDVKFNGDTGLSKRIALNGIYCNDLRFDFLIFYPDGVYARVILEEGQQYRFLKKTLKELVIENANYKKGRWGYHTGLYKVSGDTIVTNDYSSGVPFCRWESIYQELFLVLDSTHIKSIRTRRGNDCDGFEPWNDRDDVELYFTPVDPSEMPSSDSKLKRKKWLWGENFKKERK